MEDGATSYPSTSKRSKLFKVSTVVFNWVKIRVIKKTYVFGCGGDLVAAADVAVAAAVVAADRVDS
jgi:hypothetical protein